MLEADTAAGEVTVLTLLSGESDGSNWLGRFFQCLDLAVDRRRLTGEESSCETSNPSPPPPPPPLPLGPAAAALPRLEVISLL